jgi:NarL family two-component system response regulator LiaR
LARRSETGSSPTPGRKALMTPPIRVLIADDHLEARERLHLLLSEEPDIHVVGQAANGEQAVQQAIRHRPDVILMDLAMPIMNGLEALRQLREAGLRACVVALIGEAGDALAVEAMKSGAVACLAAGAHKPEALAVIRQAAAGCQSMSQPRIEELSAASVNGSAIRPPLHVALTGRERDVLRLITQGLSNKQIAMALHLSEGTVRGYVSAILAKLRVADRTQAAVYALKHGLADG